MADAQSELKPVAIWLLPALAVGAVLRFMNLTGQVLGGDELHAVRVTLLRPLGEIFFAYQRSDHCIPLSALYRLLLESGVTMTEMIFRLPVLISGLLMLLAAPLLVSRVVGRRAALIFGWLLALSPVMIYYSRIVRSYAPMVLLVFCALLFFYAWWSGGGVVRGLLAVFCSTLALYFHLGAGPIIAAPYLYALGEMAADRRIGGGERPGLKQLSLLGLLQAATVAAFLIPSRSSFQSLITAKRQDQQFSFEVLGEALRLQSGSAWMTLTLLFWLAALAGLVVLIRRSPRFGLFTLAVIVTHLAGLALLSPYGLRMVHVLNRYLIPVLPFVLLFVAVSLARLWPGDWGRQWKPAVAAGLILLLVLSGPLVNAELLASSFVHHNDFIRFASHRADPPPDRIPGFYHGLARGTVDGGPLLEYPWTTVWRQCSALYLYQRLHGQEVLVAAADVQLDDARLRFRNMPQVHAETFLASRARYLVIHLDWALEQARVQPGVWSKGNQGEDLKRLARQLAERVGRSWGRPIYQDRQVIVWDMDQVRNRLAGGGRTDNEVDQ